VTPAPVSSSETLRLRSLYQSGVLSIANAAPFDEITHIAQRAWSVGIALVAFIDNDSLHLRFTHGCESSQLSGGQPIFDHVVSTREPLIIEDLGHDARFSEKPLTLGEIEVRFCAVVPVRSPDGHVIGVLGLFDESPRDAQEVDISQLSMIARLIEREMVLALRSGYYDAVQALMDSTPDSAGTGDSLQALLALGCQYLNMTDAQVSVIDRFGIPRAIAIVEGRTPQSVPATTMAALENALLLSSHDELFCEQLRGDSTLCALSAPMESGSYMGGCGILADGTRLLLGLGSSNDRLKEGFSRYHQDFFRQLLRICSRHAEAHLQASESGLQVSSRSDSESSLRRIFEEAQIGMLLYEAGTGELVDINPTLLRWLGFSADQKRRVDVRNLTPPDSMEAERTKLNQLRRTGRHNDYEKELVDTSGRRIPVVVSSLLVRDRQGGELIFETIELTADRRTLSRLQREFVAVISHEFRTPLTALIGSLSMMDAGVGGEVPPKLAGMITLARRNSLRLTGLVDNLLDVNNLATGKLKVDLQPIDFLEVVTEVVETFKIEAKRYQARVSFKPAAEISICINADRTRISQVINSLLGNALKHTQVGGEIIVKFRSADGHASLSIQDFGPGVPKSFQEHLFVPFAMADSSDARQHAGAGLGLSISKGLTELMGGVIGFETQLREGTTFTITFPEYEKHRDGRIKESSLR